MVRLDAPRGLNGVAAPEGWPHSPAVVPCPAQSWAYALSFPLRDRPPQPVAFDLVITARVLCGEVSIGVVAPDGSTYVAERLLTSADGEGPVVLAVPALPVGAVIVRTGGAAGPAEVLLSRLDILPASGRLDARAVALRGFGGKNALEDLSRLLGAAEVIVDVGANVGDTVQAFAQRWPDSRIHAFEPCSAVAEKLAARFAGFPNVRVLPQALGQSAGEALLHTYGNSAINALSPVTAEGERFMQGEAAAGGVAVPVPVASLADYCAAQGITRIDVLKIDVQGGEAGVLAGAAALLAQKRVRAVLCEVLFVPLYAVQSPAHELMALLAAHGYALYDFYDFVHGEDGRLKWGDALFLAPGEIA